MRRAPATVFAATICLLWAGLGAGSAQAITTAPQLISPTSSSYTKSPLVIKYKLPEEAATNTVTLTILGAGEFKSVLVLTGAAAGKAGEHTVSFNTRDLAETAGVDNETPEYTELPDGVYSIDIDYQNAAHDSPAGAGVAGVHIVTVTATPTLEEVTGGGEVTGPFTVEYSLPEQALANSVELLFEGETTGTTTITLTNASAGQHAVIINPADPIEHPSEVASSSPPKLKSDKYKVKLLYNDFLFNPAASSNSVGLTIERRCTPGHFSAEGGEAPCQPAAPGHYAPGTGATSEFECVAGTYSASSAAASCLPSPAGSYAPAASANPTPCPAGTHDPDIQSTTAAACKANDPGSWSEEGAAEATLCEPGTFAAAPSSLVCLPAEPGHFVEDQGATSQRPCAAGSYTNATKTIQCMLAPVGTYAQAGAIEPTPCPPGTQALSEGQSECTLIPPASAQAADDSGSTATYSSTTINNFSTTAAPLVSALTPATPAVTQLRIDHRRIGKRTLAKAMAGGHGPAVSYRLSTAAKVSYTLLRSPSSHAASCQGRHGRCHTVARSITGTLRAGRQRTSLASILDGTGARLAKRHAHQRLAPGTYVLTAQALAGAGTKSGVASVAFTVLAR